MSSVQDILSMLSLYMRPAIVRIDTVDVLVHPLEVRLLKVAELAIKPKKLTTGTKQKTPSVVGIICKEGTLALVYTDSTKFTFVSSGFTVEYPTYKVVWTCQ